MRRKLLFIYFFCFTVLGMAQSNPYYDINLKKGNQAYNSMNYSSAISFYNSALNSTGITASQRKHIKNKIQLCNQRMRSPSRSSTKTTDKRHQIKRDSHAPDFNQIRKQQKAEAIRLAEERRRIEREKDSLERIIRERDDEIHKKQLREALMQRYDLVDKFKEGFARVHKNMRYGFINETGNEIIPLIYDFASDFSEGLASVQIGNSFGYINKTGDITIGFEFEYGGDFKEGYAVIQDQNKMGYINKNGVIVIAPKFDSAQNFEDGKAEVEESGIYYFINKEGICVENCDMTKAITTTTEPAKTDSGEVKIIHTLSDDTSDDEKYKDLLIENYPIDQSDD